jgi:GrpB-like predicted nucleotidyltransferase (UPF0157 family)
MARTIEIVPYDESWKNLYEIEKRLLESIFNNIILDIQHFGSTSIHIYQNNNICTSNYIIFRDYLKINNAALKMYESVKKDLALKYRDNPLEYTNGKTDCVNKILEEARLYFHL